MMRLPAAALTIAALLATADAHAASPNIAAGPSIDELKAKAQKGDVGAANILGLDYDMGLGVAKNPLESAKWYAVAANGGDVATMKLLGSFYSRSDNGLKDLAASASWFRKAALKGDAEAQIQLGAYYEFGVGVSSDVGAAIEWFGKAADQGSQTAMQRLAEIYRPGGPRPDSGKNYDWLHKLALLHRSAADKGDQVARSAVANDYYYGNGVSQDLAAALRWQLGLAEDGYWVGQSAAARMYEKGEGAPANYVEAYYWYSVAAINYANARVDAKRLEALMTPDQIAAAQQRVSKFVPKRAVEKKP